MNFATMSFSPIPIVAVVGGLLFGLCFGLYGMYISHRRQVMWNELARLALEKGQPMPEFPPEPHSVDARKPEEIRASRTRGLIVGGLVNIAVGAGLFLALSQVSKPTAYFAAIPGFIGVALLLGALIDGVLSRKSGN